VERYDQSLLSSSVYIGGVKTIVLLEDNPEHADVARKVVQSLGYSLIVGSDWESALELAKSKAQFFILDIKLGPSSNPDRVKGGLRALELLRLRFGDSVFVAILTALKEQNARAIERLRPNIALQKTHRRSEDMAFIINAYEKWLDRDSSSEGAEVRDLGSHVALDAVEAEFLFPSDELAVKITGASLNDMAVLLQERIAVSALLGQRPPEHSDLEREIGTRMRDELRGVLMEIAERGRAEGRSRVTLSSGRQLARELVRLIFRFLPIVDNSESIMDQLREELHVVARLGYIGEWGVIKVEDGDVILDATEEDFNEHEQP